MKLCNLDCEYMDILPNELRCVKYGTPVTTGSVCKDHFNQVVNQIINDVKELDTKDLVNHPPHYESGKFECIDVMVETQGVEAVQHFCICNAFKYLYRHERKNGVEDIKKAIWYLNKYIELEDGKEESDD